jgi:hypothetical protein
LAAEKTAVKLMLKNDQKYMLKNERVLYSKNGKNQSIRRNR